MSTQGILTIATIGLVSAVFTGLCAPLAFWAAKALNRKINAPPKEEGIPARQSHG
jgi:hypothetical protein